MERRDEMNTMHGRFGPNSRPGFLSGGGNMGPLVRAHDWAHPRWGLPASWPQSLQNARQRHAWLEPGDVHRLGAEPTLLYNDGYAEILARKHPAARAATLLEVWSELRDDLLPIVERPSPVSRSI